MQGVVPLVTALSVAIVPSVVPRVPQISQASHVSQNSQVPTGATEGASRRGWLRLILVVLDPPPDGSGEPGGVRAPEALRQAGPCSFDEPCGPHDPPPPMVTVGNPGNPADDTGYGAVDHVFEIGRYEVTAAQYVVFLNAVARSDTYGLYNPAMASAAGGCGIQRLGSSGAHTYRVPAEQALRPVNFVSWGDAARYANWRHNGRPRGAQNLTTTEDGAYFLNGAMGDSQLLAMQREPDAVWALPSEDEWYKAAYHANDGVTASYFRYPGRSNVSPTATVVDPDPGNHATYWRNGYTIGAPWFRTRVGEHENSPGPYGTFDQGGNVQEYNEAVVDGFSRGVRGGSYQWGSSELNATTRPYEYYTTDEFAELGFRVVHLP